jgi:predicted anti-sigma-YlaC factor YlaD
LASCKLDGELTEFESTGLERHRAGCVDCAEWMRELGYLTSAIQLSEPVRLREPVAARLLVRRARRFPALAAASASIGAAFLAAIAVALPGSSGVGGEQAMTGSLLNPTVDPPPRSFVLASFKRAQRSQAPSAPSWHRPQGKP